MASIPKPITPPGGFEDHKRPVPSVPVFSADNADVDAIIHGIVQSGGCIIRNVIPLPVLDQIELDTRPHLLAEQQWSGSFFPPHTKRVCGLAGKSKTFTERIVAHPLLQAISDRLLTSMLGCWVGEDTWEPRNVSRPQLNNTIVFSIEPGAVTPQPLHRDDMIHHNRPVRRASPNEYDPAGGDVAGVGFFVAAKPSTARNGATRFIPGSHLWAHETPPREALAVHAELGVGDAFVFLSGCYHGGSANTTPDEERLLYSFFMTRGYLRQEENQYLACGGWEGTDKMGYTDEVLALLGYAVSNPFLGWLDLKSPLDALRGVTGLKDLF